MTPSTSRTPIAASAPAEAQLTDYDRAHLTIYLRLLDAEAEGARWEDVARVVLEIDPAREPDRACQTYRTHMDRARWLTEHGYRDLLDSSL
jgi:hypothetical protein